MPRGAKTKTFEEKFWPKVEADPNSGCWLWTGAVYKTGYAALTHFGVCGTAHRMAYRYFVGEIPADLVADHKCRTRCCVNPKHIEPVTQLENIRRSIAAGFHVGAATACPRGHAYDADNIIWVEGRRRCRACASSYYRRNTRRAKEAV